jgi:hypothetical protein
MPGKAGMPLAMDWVDGISCPNLAQPRPFRMHTSEGHTEPAPTGSRALILIQARNEPPGTAASRPCGLFLAQLIAMAQRSPQTCRHRRATPEEAHLAYAASAAPPAWLGRALYRCM